MIINKLINRPIAVTMIVVAVVVLGSLAWSLLPVGLMPAIDIPEITVRVNAPNRSARELNASVIGPLKNQLMQTSHLKNIRSSTQNGRGMIFMQFDYGSNLDYIFIDVNERVDKATSGLPRDIERPTVIKASATDIPAFYINVTSSDDRANMLQVSEFTETVIAKRLESLPQVAFVDISGQSYSELVIVPDMDKMEALGFTTSDLQGAILGSNINLGNLILQDGHYQYNVRFNSTIESRSDIENIKLNIDGRIYSLHEIAAVKEQAQPVQGVVISDSRAALTMAVIKQADARMDDLQEGVDDMVTMFRKDYPDLRFTITRDQTELLDYSIGNMTQNLVLGALLAALVLFLFMQDLRTPVLVTIAIPLAMMVSLLFFYLLGISINIISLSGLLLGLGMMVDNSIIVIDNISQRWQRGESLLEATGRGAGEVFSAMLSSVLTTCSIFIPLVFMSGIAGAMFYDQAVSVTTGLFSSLIVAILVIPVYYHLLYRHSGQRKINRFLKKLEIVDYERLYERGLKWTFRHQGWVWVMVVIMICGSVVVYGQLGKQAIPTIQRTDAMLHVNWNQQITAEHNQKLTEEFVRNLSQKQHYTSFIGRQQFMLSHTPELGVSEALVYVKAKDNRTLDDLIAESKRYITTHHPQATLSEREACNIFNMIFADTEPQLMAQIKATSGLGIEPVSLTTLLQNISDTLPGVYVEPIEYQEHVTLYANTELMKLYGIEYLDVVEQLRRVMNQNEIFAINKGQFSLPVIVGSMDMTMDEILSNLSIKNKLGATIPLNTILDQRVERDMKNIISGTQGDYYPLSLEVEDKDVDGTMARIKAVVADNSAFEVDFSGSHFSNMATRRQLIMILVVSLLLLYFILAAQFESLVQPMIILSEIVVDIFGALFLLWICGASLNIMSLIGLIVMCGIVINDSILKVDTINRLRRSGMGTMRAVLTGGRRRLKPIIMTSLTTIFAILPFLFQGGMGNDLQRPMSLTLIGGMVVGTIVSLFFIPLAYYYVYRKR